MLSKVLTVLSWLWGKKTWWITMLMALLLASGVWGYTQGLRLKVVQAEAAKRIQVEEAAHDTTRMRLAQADAENLRLRAMLDSERNATLAVQGSLRDALKREADAAGAASVRKRILDAMRLRVRTEKETLEVVDDATRAAVAARLNRPL